MHLLMSKFGFLEVQHSSVNFKARIMKTIPKTEHKIFQLEITERVYQFSCQYQSRIYYTDRYSAVWALCSQSLSQNIPHRTRKTVSVAKSNPPSIQSLYNWITPCHRKSWGRTQQTLDHRGFSRITLQEARAFSFIYILSSH